MRTGTYRYIYITAFLLTSVICITALFAAALIPQGRIAGNIARSLPGFVNEGTYPRLKEGSSSATLDNFTDSLTMMEVLGMNDRNLGAVFSNPLYLQKTDPMESLVNYAAHPDLEPDGYYVRYWMGFRVSLRLLFSFFNYSQIRRINLLLLAGLAALSMVSVAKHVNIPSALGLGICLLLMRPLIIARSFQYSTCFLIALSAMPLVPGICQRKLLSGLFFLLLGMLTQFFDFYSVPALTLCLPLLYLLAIQATSGQTARVGEAACAALSWLGGYVLFWLEKLLLASAFSPLDGLQNGFDEFLYWMKPRSDSVGGCLGSVFRNVGRTVCPNPYAALVLGALVLALILYAFGLIRRGRLDGKRVWNPALVFTTVIPFLWMCIAARPTAHHAFFQYRSLAAVFWGLCLFVTSTAEAARLRFPARREKTAQAP